MKRSKQPRTPPPPPWFESRLEKSALGGPDFYMIKIGPGRWRIWNGETDVPERLDFPASHDVNSFSDGKFRYRTYGRNDRVEQPCIEDLKDEEARKEWHRYVEHTLPDGRVIHGPAPFRNSEEREEYHKRFGFKEYDRGETYPGLRERLRAALKRRPLRR
jgi:hypothetical protein